MPTPSWQLVVAKRGSSAVLAPQDDGAAAASFGREVVEFCSRRGILRSLLLARDLLRRHFADALSESAHLVAEERPGNEWVLLKVVCPGPVSSVRAAFRRFTDEFLAHAEPAAIATIQLTYGVHPIPAQVGRGGDGVVPV